MAAPVQAILLACLLSVLLFFPAIEARKLGEIRVQVFVFVYSGGAHNVEGSALHEYSGCMNKRCPPGHPVADSEGVHGRVCMAGSSHAICTILLSNGSPPFLPCARMMVHAAVGMQAH